MISIRRLIYAFTRKYHLVRFVSVDDDSSRINEGIWCERIGFRTFRVENLPFVTRSVAYQDIVSCSFSREEWYAEKILRKSEYWNIWLVGDLDVVDDIVSRYSEVMVEYASDQRVSIGGSVESLSSIVRLLRKRDIEFEVASEPYTGGPSIIKPE